MPLAVGNIVTVIFEDCMYFEQQGEVVEIVEDGDSDGPVGVKFGKWCKHLFNSFHDGNFTTVRFEEVELRKDADWGIEVKAVRCYGARMWHSLCSLRRPFDPKGKCQTENCTHFCDQRCLINIWGTVSEIDLCMECAKQYHGKCGEMWPAKPLTRVAA